MKRKFTILCLCLCMAGSLVACKDKDSIDDLAETIEAEPIVSDELWISYQDKMGVFASDYNDLLKATKEGYLTDKESLSCLEDAKDLIARTAEVDHVVITDEEINVFIAELDELITRMDRLLVDVDFEVSALANIPVTEKTYQSLQSTADELEKQYNDLNVLLKELNHRLEGDEAELAVDVEDYIIKSRNFNQTRGLEEDAQAIISAMISSKFKLQEIYAGLQ